MARHCICAAPAMLVLMVIIVAGTTKYAEAKSGLVGAAGAAAAKQVGKGGAKAQGEYTNCRCYQKPDGCVCTKP